MKSTQTSFTHPELTTAEATLSESRLAQGRKWFDTMGWTPFPFQEAAWRAYWNGDSGIVSAPTGFGKTNALCVPALLGYEPDAIPKGLKVIWVTPIRALAKEIAMAWEKAAAGLGVDWEVGIRTGDTSSSRKSKQLKAPPDVMITTPESIHVLLSNKGYSKFFASLDAIIIDEWHELVGSKRGVLVELALARLKGLRPNLQVWGISATIGNMDEAMEVLFGTRMKAIDPVFIRADVQKDIRIESIVPDDINKFPWAGYYGLTMVDKVVEVLKSSGSTIIFTNTRAMCERWYQRLLEVEPDLSGQIAMHHGSISRDIRDWVEEALHDGRLKAVVSTSSLDLGVDFRPVDTVVQIGSPKGVARCIQRAGRSGHQPGALSRIFFIPTHALELVEAAALRKAIEAGVMESRMPYVRSFDVLVQFLITLAVSEGFEPKTIFEEISQTFCYSSISPAEWRWVLNFIVNGGESLQAYEEFRKVEIENGRYIVRDRRVKLRHKLSIGTIVSSGALQVKYLSGKNLGSIEEIFITKLTPGEAFWFAGRNLEFVKVRGNTALVRRTRQKASKVPAWAGGRMPLSSQLSRMLRAKVVQFSNGNGDLEMNELKPLFDLQMKNSMIPSADEFLIEYFTSRDGHHLIMYPFEGRFVHEGMGALFAKRISRIKPITFTIAMNDYGFELLSDQEIPIEEAISRDLFSTENLEADIQASVNAIEMAKRKFYDICRISGLVFQGYPGKQKKDRHLQVSTGLLYEVFQDYDPDNLLFQQAYDEAMYFQLEKVRLKEALDRIARQKPVIARPGRFTPFALPIIADSLREKLSSEKLEQRIERMKMALLRD